jgi:hypothetical protein
MSDIEDYEEGAFDAGYDDDDQSEEGDFAVDADAGFEGDEPVAAEVDEDEEEEADEGAEEELGTYLSCCSVARSILLRLEEVSSASRTLSTGEDDTDEDGDDEDFAEGGEGVSRSSMRFL